MRQPLGSDVPIDWCDGPTEGRFAPLDDPQLSVFPDDEWTIDDDSSPTGQRVDVAGAAWLEEMPLGVVDVEQPLGVLSGWGRLGAMFLRTWAPIGELPTDSVASVTEGATSLTGPGTSKTANSPVCGSDWKPLRNG